MKKTTLTILLGIMLTGCMNIVYHIPPEAASDVYEPTCYVACNGVGSWWNDEFKKRYPIEAAWMQLTWLVWIVDLPCEAVMDTLWFPYDLHRKHVVEEAKAKQNKNSRFSASQEKQYEINGQYEIKISD